MESAEEIIRAKAIRAFNEYKDYVELSNQQNKAKKDTLEKVKELYKEDKGDPEIKDFSFEVFLIDGYHKQDIRNLGIKFVHYTSLYKELTEAKPLDDEIETSYEYLKNNAMEKQYFVVEGKKFVEREKGFIEEQRKIFDDKNLFAKVQGELEKLL